MFENIIIFLIIVSCLNIIIVSNPVQSLLWLILTFSLSAMIFMFFGVELMSVLIFMIYLGAIAVLFLFVIMMLNIKVVELRFSYLRYLSVSFFIIIFFFFEILLSIIFEFNEKFYNNFFYNYWFFLLDFKGNLFMLGSIIFEYNIILFFLLGIILFISMLCSIILLMDNNEKIHNINLYNSINFFSKKFINFLK